MNETTIRLPDGTVNYLQRLDYELGGLQVLHTHALNAGTPLERRMEIRREFQETFTEYQLAKNEMWAEFAPRFPGAVNWRVNFETGELHVEVPECGVGRELAPAGNTQRGGDIAAGSSPRPTGAAEVVPHA